MAVVSSLHESARASANLGGTVLSDRYRVTESLRSSAMSHVYVAEDLVKHKRVAIKVLRDELCDER
ncbi:MAG TPA: hypothetical protein VFQ35_28400, partial [Polyangiaceae bacterium]|nr:hypothetical protein [Polyangiaceae bacterium]